MVINIWREQFKRNIFDITKLWLSYNIHRPIRLLDWHHRIIETTSNTCILSNATSQRTPGVLGPTLGDLLHKAIANLILPFSGFSWVLIHRIWPATPEHHSLIGSLAIPPLNQPLVLPYMVTSGGIYKRKGTGFQVDSHRTKLRNEGSVGHIQHITQYPLHIRAGTWK
jgi:hypothetical protein